MTKNQISVDDVFRPKNKKIADTRFTLSRFSRPVEKIGPGR